MLKRAVSLGGLGGQLGKGILTGAGLTAAIDGIEHLIGGDSSQPQYVFIPFPLSARPDELMNISVQAPRTRVNPRRGRGGHYR